MTFSIVIVYCRWRFSCLQVFPKPDVLQTPAETKARVQRSTNTTSARAQLDIWEGTARVCEV